MKKLLQVWGLVTVLMLMGATVSYASAFRIGDQGSEVAEIQGQLAGLGYERLFSERTA